ncbi:MAG: hypothetical protein F6J98_16995, partial [Moorea sp. SIO4G2]|nr:hypothetical protein [Moorena sp. SIO4G2]
ENSRTVLPSPSFLAPRSGSGDFSSAMLLWSRYAIDLDQKATLREWSRGARCSFGAATRTHFVGWAWPETNAQPCPNLPNLCAPKDSGWVLVGIAHLFYKLTILI